MIDGFNFVVLAGHYSGDGSSMHRDMRLVGGDRVPFFQTLEDAQKYAIDAKLEDAVIAEVTVTVHRETLLTKRFPRSLARAAE